MTRTPWRALAASTAVTAGIALAVRAFYLVQLRHAPEFLHPVLDAAAHLEWARAFLAGTWPGGEPYFRAPGYVWALAAALRLTGDDPSRVAALQLLLGSVTPILTALLAGRWFGPRAALLAGVAATLDPMLLFFDAQLLVPVLGVPLLIASVLGVGEMTASKRSAVAFGSGLVAGAAVIVRPPLALAILCVVVLVAVRREVGRRRLVLWLVGCALLPGFVTAQNAMRGDAVFVASQGGLNFYLGNGASADGHSATFTERPELVGYAMLEGARGIAESERGHPLRPSEVSSYWAARAWREIATDPLRWLRLLAKKSFLFGFVREIPNNHDPVLFEERFPFLRWLPGWGVWAPLGIAGWILARRRAGVAQLGAAVFGVFVSCVAFFVNARFRIPALPFLIALAAGGWVSIASVRGKLGMVLVATGVSALFHWNPYAIPTRVWVPSYVLLASAERDRHEPVRALRWIERALEEAPGFYPARMLQIELLRDAGRVAEATELARRGVEGMPDNAAIHSEYGALLELSGRPDEALREIEVAIRLDPEYDPARVNRAIVLARLGRTDEALAVLRRLLARPRPSAEAERAAELTDAIRRGELTPRDRSP